MSSRPKLPLDPSFYNLQDDELAFFKTQTGIYDDEGLKEHILGVQEEAYAICPYPCIRVLTFTKLEISNHPVYDAVLRIGKERRDAILLDLGCCFGNDIRKVIADGYPLKSAVASDIRPEFWNLGHKLFRSSQESFPVRFLAGDIFDPKFLSPTILFASSWSSPPSPVPPLASVSSLTQLQHHVSVIYISAVFHLFSKTQQRDLAHFLGALLSPMPGSVIFGSHTGVEDTEENKDGNELPVFGVPFRHSRSSWEKLWVGEGGVFSPGDVDLSTSTTKFEKETVIQVGLDPTSDVYFLTWSVTRT